MLSISLWQSKWREDGSVGKVPAVEDLSRTPRVCVKKSQVQSCNVSAWEDMGGSPGLLGSQPSLVGALSSVRDPVSKHTHKLDSG